MPIFFPVTEFFEQSGNSAARFGEELRDEIARGACDIWSTNPYFITNGRDPLSSFARGFMNQMCNGVTPTPVYEPPPFIGGQCCDKTYIVLCSWQFIQCNGNIAAQGSGNPTITGKVLGLSFAPNPQAPNQWELRLNFVDCENNEDSVGLISTTTPIDQDCSDWQPGDPGASNWDLSRSTFQIDNISTADGSPDDCGNPPGGYPVQPPPPPGSLTQNFTINNVDNTATVWTLEWNQTNPSYNFPMTFKINGVNASLDVGGITIYGSPGVSSPGGENTTPPPGSDGGRDEGGNTYVNVFENGDYAGLPIITNPETIEQTVEQFVCNSGVIEVITDVVRALPGASPLELIIVELLNAVIEEICAEEASTVDLGFPEVYPVLPGAGRPAILYYYKEFINGERQKSTYTSTVSNPSLSAINNIDNVVVPDKLTGSIIYSVTLLDGSRIVTTGLDNTEASDNFTFLINQVSSAFVPPDLASKVVVTERQGVVERLVKCTQIEYYPNGRASSVAPAIRRIIDPT